MKYLFKGIIGIIFTIGALVFFVLQWILALIWDCEIIEFAEGPTIWAFNYEYWNDIFPLFGKKPLFFTGSKYASFKFKSYFHYIWGIK